MTTAFDMVPVSITPETIDMVNNEYLRMQREGDIDLTDPRYSTEFRADVISSQLDAIAEFPDNDNSSIIIRLAALTMAWVEILNG